jgi:(5-formylfuran-3-yl)methyl phosphate synthase
VRLLVSVRSAAELEAALAGGADIIDLKEPERGSLGAPDERLVAAAAARVPAMIPLSVALGDPMTVTAAELTVRRLMPGRKGEVVLKMGFAGAATEDRAGMLLAATVAAARPALIVAVAYADWTRADSPPPLALIGPAIRAGAHGVLLDTFAKDGRDLFDLMPVEAVRSWVEEGRAAGLLTAVAGSLDGSSLELLNQIRPDVVGVRGAACNGGRLGRVAEDRVRALRTALDRAVSPTGATAKRQRISPVTSS